MRWPAARSSRTQRRRSGIVPSSIMVKTGSGASVEAVLRTGIRAVPHLRTVGADGSADRLAQFGVALEKFGCEHLVEAEHVVQHQHLPVAARSRADADRGNGERLR